MTQTIGTVFIGGFIGFIFIGNTRAIKGSLVSKYFNILLNDLFRYIRIWRFLYIQNRKYWFLYLRH